MSCELHKRVVRKWMTYAPELWWGDFIDIRFYLTEKLAELSGQMILDLGCNAGVIASECETAGSRVVGLDMNLDALGRYQRLFSDLKLPARPVRGSWNALMFKKESFDVLVLSWILCYDMDNREKNLSLKAMHELLKPGGKLYFVESNRDCPIQGENQAHFWTAAEARDMLESNGFKVEELAGWNPLPSLLFWLPLNVKMRLPRNLLIYLSPPGRLVQYLPGWYKLFRLLSKYEWLWKYCRSYYLCARKV